jgi:tetrahydromethanopterin:alpha-L-glutamate ligase
MRLVVLTSGNGWHVQDLARAAARRGHELVAAPWRDLTGTVGGAGCAARAGNVVLDDADAVLLRTMPGGSLEQIVLRMDLLHRLVAAGVTVVNPPRAIETAVDKYLALVRMQAAGLPVPPTVVCQRAADARRAFDDLGGDVVIKPIFGSEGVGMTRVSDADLADRAFALVERMNAVIYVQRYIDHGGSDVRLFVVGGRVCAAMRRRGEGWRTNIAQGGRGEPMDPAASPELCDLAVRAAAACDAHVAGIDVLFDPRKQPFVLEANAVPGWRELSRVTGVDVAAVVIAHVERLVGAPEAAHA